METPEKLLTPKDAAEVLGRSTTSLKVLRCRGRGPAYLRQGGRIRYRMDDLISWGRTEPEQATAEQPLADARRAGRSGGPANG